MLAYQTDEIGALGALQPQGALGRAIPCGGSDRPSGKIQQIDALIPLDGPVGQVHTSARVFRECFLHCGPLAVIALGTEAWWC